MKKSTIVQVKENQPVNRDDEASFKSITRGLDIESRTICPPSEELIKQLNQIASKPPFSFVYKAKDRFPIL
jgi:hypothetical protein